VAGAAGGHALGQAAGWTWVGLALASPGGTFHHVIVVRQNTCN
jgi:hypothetical protein